MRIDLDVNGVRHALDIEPRTTLLDCLRDHLKLTGAHAGCEHGVCGACTVEVDGAAVRGCLMLAVQADGAEVWTVEIVEEFAGEASLRLQQLGYNRVQVRIGDGSRGWIEHAPFDRILVTAAARTAPPALVEQLKPDGKMVAPIGPREVQQLSVVTKDAAGEAQVREVIPVRFTQLEV